MDSALIRATLANLESLLERARDVRIQMENEIENEIYGESNKGGGYEKPEAAFTSFLDDAHEVLMLVLEAAGLPETRDRLVKKWAGFEKLEKGIGTTKFVPEFDYLESQPFEYLNRLVNGLRISSGEGLKPFDSYELSKLEMILRRTPVLLRKRGVEPKGELDVQNVMHDYLEAFFVEYKHPVTINGVIRDFKPDGGVRNLKAAIEFKYAATQSEVAKALGGVFEDVSGYTGSLDWVNFYTLIYQTEPFESEDRVKSELSRAGTLTWNAFLVTGKGSRALRNRRKVPPSPPA